MHNLKHLKELGYTDKGLKRESASIKVCSHNMRKLLSRESLSVPLFKTRELHRFHSKSSANENRKKGCGYRRTDKTFRRLLYPSLFCRHEDCFRRQNKIGVNGAFASCTFWTHTRGALFQRRLQGYAQATVRLSGYTRYLSRRSLHPDISRFFWVANVDFRQDRYFGTKIRCPLCATV